MARNVWVAASLLIAGVLLTLAAPPPGLAQVGDRPNFVVVLVDDMRWDDFGAGGHPFVRTPNIDRVAAEGAGLWTSVRIEPMGKPVPSGRGAPGPRGHGG